MSRGGMPQKLFDINLNIEYNTLNWRTNTMDLETYVERVLDVLNKTQEVLSLNKDDLDLLLECYGLEMPPSQGAEDLLKFWEDLDACKDKMEPEEPEDYGYFGQYD